MYRASDERLGEIVVAIIEVKPGQAMTEERRSSSAIRCPGTRDPENLLRRGAA